MCPKSGVDAGQGAGLPMQLKELCNTYALSVGGRYPASERAPRLLPEGFFTLRDELETEDRASR